MLDAIACPGSSSRAAPGAAWRWSEETDRARARALHAGGVRGVRFNIRAHLGGAPDPRVFEPHARDDRAARLARGAAFDAKTSEAHAGMFRRQRWPFVIDHMGRVQAQHGIDQKPFRKLLDLMNNELALGEIERTGTLSAAGKPFNDAVPFARRGRVGA